MDLLLMLLKLATALAQLTREALEILTTAQDHARQKRKRGRRR